MSDDQELREDSGGEWSRSEWKGKRDVEEDVVNATVDRKEKGVVDSTISTSGCRRCVYMVHNPFLRLFITHREVNPF